MHPCSATLQLQLSDEDETTTLSINLRCELTREQHRDHPDLDHAFTFVWAMSDDDRALLQLDPDLQP